ncbi:hypothetical protein Pta02_47770 [Planobispora takensis]|uniref:Uncharacterized protein n=1 Tax=Planobispora takensis TaxID=1367882 RepID=A0A8J3WUC1_9ACTN|nr:hypothetical protein Pta02_47770 [Planobispora takensis]
MGAREADEQQHADLPDRVQQVELFRLLRDQPGGRTGGHHVEQGRAEQDTGAEFPDHRGQPQLDREPAEREGEKEQQSDLQ